MGIIDAAVDKASKAYEKAQRRQVPWHVPCNCPYCPYSSYVVAHNSGQPAMHMDQSQQELGGTAPPYHQGYPSPHAIANVASPVPQGSGSLPPTYESQSDDSSSDRKKKKEKEEKKKKKKKKKKKDKMDLDGVLDMLEACFSDDDWF